MNKKVAVVVPLYKTMFSPEEKTSFRHLRHYLKKYDKYYVVPNHLPKGEFEALGGEIISFPKEFFASVQRYSEMLIREEFYLPFVSYEYILIYQLDALVFSDKLDDWCQKDYDYIGAPWFRPTIGRLSHKEGFPISGGNGGLSLRKVESFLRVIRLAKKIAKRESDSSLLRKWWFIAAVLTQKAHEIWLNSPPQCYPFHEDGFWSFEAPKYDPSFTAAPFEVALQFSFEENPRECFRLNHFQLPFGCHAWERFDKGFWTPYLLAQDRDEL